MSLADRGPGSRGVIHLLNDLKNTMVQRLAHGEDDSLLAIGLGFFPEPDNGRPKDLVVFTTDEFHREPNLAIGAITGFEVVEPEDLAPQYIMGWGPTRLTLDTVEEGTRPERLCEFLPDQGRRRAFPEAVVGEFDHRAVIAIGDDAILPQGGSSPESGHPNGFAVGPKRDGVEGREVKGHTVVFRGLH